MKKFLCLFSAFALTAVSCSKDDEKSNSASSSLPKTIELTNPAFPSENKISTITYDGNKIVSISNVFSKTDFTYNGNHIIKKVDYYIIEGQEVKSGETAYTYLNGKLETVTGSKNGQVFRQVYTYNVDGTVKKESYSTDKTTGIESKDNDAELFTLENGNLTKHVSTADNFTTTDVYGYDTKNNVFKNVIGFVLLLDQEITPSLGQEIYSSINNVKKRTNSLVQNDKLIYGPVVYPTECDYNSNDYPTKKITHNEDGSVKEIFNYTY